MFFGLLQHEEDVDVLERLRLGVARVGAGQEAAVDRELGVEVIAHLGLTRRGVLLLPVVQLKPALEFSERLVDGQHQVFLQ